MSIQKKILCFFKFIPFVKRIIDRKYLGLGIGTYFINSFFKNILRINTGKILVHFTSKLNFSEKIYIGIGENSNNPYFSFASSGSCYYQAMNGIKIGEGTIWAYGCKFISANHSFTNLNKHEIVQPITIGKFVWIGANSVILPTVEIGNYVIIGAGSIVTKSFPAYTIIAGNPAKLIGKRCVKCLNKLDNNKCLKCDMK